ncbi:MerR family transcriptional regulator [Geomicrobium sp. JCM 19038]|uniref:MerR family transcriptional regulator n=1 Tax=Geomicrobium sp. JCM 19038 TaxID=1460635 RepID=UPI00045F42DF|nr:MerR family transcriptional regulator [Geomicrobium sp. JCM 19038]GAK08708.1 transcriptional regulator, merR family [Geomicrobium sp. JCM 19038]
MLQVKEVSKLTGVSVRTLHHYDHIGLLTPESATESGYRLYSQKDLMHLQEILFFRELGFPLKQIKSLMSDPSYSRSDALRMQKRLLTDRVTHIQGMIEMIDGTLEQREGDLDMTEERHFKGFKFSESDSYEAEARELYGDQAVDEGKAKIKGNEQALQEEMNDIYRELAQTMEHNPTSKEAQVAIEQWYNYLNRMGSYSKEAFAGLGEMYISDERFQQNIDQFRPGLAEWMRDAMKVYAGN